MPQAQEVASWIGWEVVDVSGDKIGKLEAIYLDAETDQPEWALIKTGLFGGRSPLVPLAGAESEGETVRVNFPKDQVKDAPSMKANEELSQQEEAQLYHHYGLEYSFVPSGSGLGEGGAAGEPGAGSDASQATGEPGDASQASGSQGAGTEATAAGIASAGSGGAPTQTGSAGDAPGTPGSAATEQGSTGDASGSGVSQPGSGGDAAAAEGAASGGAGGASAAGPSGRVQEAAEGQASEVIRLKKYIVTEHVPVQHEEVRVEREPVDESDEAS
ncbi:MAG TPA: PRC-barrel domain-containing protein [Thermoleophilaceae bacterium]|nr:PRC-barrel domain-containing protein [Thermoleophilaceae bacterium]